MGLTGARSSVFPSRVRRPAFPSIGQGVRFIEVATEDQLRAALTPRDTSTITRTIANVGRRIVIVAPITIKSPVIVDELLAGTTIEAHGYLPIVCGVDGIDAFDIRAPLVTLRGLLITAPAIDGTSGGAAFNRAVWIKARDCRVIDCHGFGVDTLVEGAAEVNGCQVRGCTIGAGGNGTDRYGVIYDGAGWRIEANDLQAAGAGVAVYGGTASERSSISGNLCNAGGIDTSAGIGSNTIHGNPDAGTVTNHATDAVGLNT